MSRVTGLGGVFIKADNPKELAAWYQKHLGIGFGDNTYVSFAWSADEASADQQYSVLTFFKKSSAYFNPSQKECMLNLRVTGLPGLLEQLKTDGVTVMEETESGEYGNFGWIVDPEGNKIELWEPPVKTGTN